MGYPPPKKKQSNEYFPHFQPPPFEVFTSIFALDTLRTLLGGMYMRFALFFFLGLLLWAGTVSINYGNRTSSTSSAVLSCSESGDGETLLDYLYTGRITGIRDNGQMLTVGLTPQWSTLSADFQHGTYEAIACYARAQQRAFQFISTP
jgi:hypothetical protein